MQKKILAVLLAVSLCFCLSAGALASMSSNPTTARIAVDAGTAAQLSDDSFTLTDAGDAKAEVDGTHAANIVMEAVASGDAGGLTVTGGATFTLGGAEDNVEFTYPTFLGETETASFNSAILMTDDGSGNAASIDEGILFIENSYLEAYGARRMTVSAHGEATLVFNDSVVVSYGGTEGGIDTNQKLLVGGITRTNFSEAATTTYYFNSKCISDGWAAMSTDSARAPGLYFYSYNSVGISYWGGYATYADTTCYDYFYASELYGEDMAVIISNNGEIYALPGSDAGEDILQYNTGATSDAGSAFWGGRNCFEIHAPNMNHASNEPGSASGQKTAIVVIKDSLVGVDKSLENPDGLDFGATYGAAYGAYVDFIDGAVFLIKSTCCDITLDNAEVVSPNGIIMMTVVNNDDTPYTLASGDVAEGKLDTLNMANGSYDGDVLHYDYMRPVQVNLVSATWNGKTATWDYDAWQAAWEAYAADAACTWYIPDFAGYESLGTGLFVDAASVWNVTGDSQLTSLTVEAGGKVNGIVTVNGVETDVSMGGSWEGDIVVTAAAGASAADGSTGGMSISLNGQDLGSFDVGGPADEGSFSFNLKDLLTAFGLSLNFDETTGTLTLQDASGLLGSMLGVSTNADAAAPADAAATDEVPADDGTDTPSGFDVGMNAGLDASVYPHFDEYRDYVDVICMADSFMGTIEGVEDDIYAAASPYIAPFSDINPVIGAMDYPDWMNANYPGESFPTE